MAATINSGCSKLNNWKRRQLSHDVVRQLFLHRASLSNPVRHSYKQEISGGAGAGATAHATIDGGGNLTGTVVDSRGNGYPPSDSLTADLLGGGGSGAVTGAGITTLTGVSAYMGNTTVNPGGTVVLADNGFARLEVVK